MVYFGLLLPLLLGAAGLGIDLGAAYNARQRVQAEADAAATAAALELAKGSAQAVVTSAARPASPTPSLAPACGGSTARPAPPRPPDPA